MPLIYAVELCISLITCDCYMWWNISLDLITGVLNMSYLHSSYRLIVCYAAGLGCRTDKMAPRPVSKELVCDPGAGCEVA